MSSKIFVLMLDGKPCLEQPSMEWMPITFEVGQGIVVDGLPLLVTSVGSNDGGRILVTVERQSDHQELFCPDCGGSRGATSDRRQCQKKRFGKCFLPKPEEQKPKKD